MGSTDDVPDRNSRRTPDSVKVGPLGENPARKGERVASKVKRRPWLPYRIGAPDVSYSLSDRVGAPSPPGDLPDREFLHPGDLPERESVRPKDIPLLGEDEERLLSLLSEQCATFESVRYAPPVRLLVRSGNPALMHEVMDVVVQALTGYGYSVGYQHSDRNLGGSVAVRRQGLNSYILAGLEAAQAHLDGAPSDVLVVLDRSFVQRSKGSTFIGELPTKRASGSTAGYAACADCGAIPAGGSVFISHGGGSREWVRLRSYLDSQNINYTEFNSPDPPLGLETTARLGDMLSVASVGIAIMSAEDLQGTDAWRARENVVHEIGLLHGHVGFDRVALVREKGLTVGTNIRGLQAIEMGKEGIEPHLVKIRNFLDRFNIVRL